MKKDLTEIVVVMDKSGSMVDIKSDMLGGLNSFIEEQKKVPGEVTFSLVFFSSVYPGYYGGKEKMSLQKKYYRASFDEVEKVKDKDYIPNGGTPLYDAVGNLVIEIGKILSETDEKDRPETVLFVIVTDGLENTSSEFNAEKLKALITQQESVYKWKFVYLGANQNAMLEANKMNISSSLTYDTANSGDMYNSVSLYASVLRSEKRTMANSELKATYDGLTKQS